MPFFERTPVGTWQSRDDFDDATRERDSRWRRRRLRWAGARRTLPVPTISPISPIPPTTPVTPIPPNTPVSPSLGVQDDAILSGLAARGIWVGPAPPPPGMMVLPRATRALRLQLEQQSPNDPPPDPSLLRRVFAVHPEFAIGRALRMRVEARRAASVADEANAPSEAGEAGEANEANEPGEADDPGDRAFNDRQLAAWYFSRGVLALDDLVPDPVARPVSTTHRLVCDFIDWSEKTSFPNADVPNEFLCPLSLHAMRDPVACSDGRVYERSHIDAWARSPTGNGLSPITRAPMSPQRFPCKPLVSLMEAWVEARLCVGKNSLEAALREHSVSQVTEGFCGVNI
jgi:hypothetical protein